MANNDIVPGFDDELRDGLSLRLELVAGLEGCLLIELVGDLDAHTSASLQGRAMKAIEGGYRNLILGAAGLGFVSSSGIGCLTALSKRLKPLGGDLVILDCAPKAKATLDLIGFSQYFNFAATLAEARDHFMSPGASGDAQAFPKHFPCPLCAHPLLVRSPGLYRCTKCRTSFLVTEKGEVFVQ